MSKLKGISVEVIEYRPTDRIDEFNRPIYEEDKGFIKIYIDNVLIAPSSSDEILNAQELYGKKAVYTLAIPKNRWFPENAEFKFFGQRWRPIGPPLEGIDDLIPLDWNKKVMVERIE